MAQLNEELLTRMLIQTTPEKAEPIKEKSA